LLLCHFQFITIGWLTAWQAVEKLLEAVFFRIARSIALHLVILATFFKGLSTSHTPPGQPACILASLPNH